MELEKKYQHDFPRVAAIHDLCGYGNCSLAVALPVLSAAGIDALAVPTALLSNHTHYPSFTFRDTTEDLEAYFEAWKKIDVRIDGVYSGFLGSLEQIDLIGKFIKLFNPKKIIVDPVMGDNGKAYPTYTADMCNKMKELAKNADVLLPNLTEAAILLEREFTGRNITKQQTLEIATSLQKLGAKNIVLKGIVREKGTIINAVLLENGEYKEISNEEQEYYLHGTGDLFASVVSAGILSNKTLVEAVDFSTYITSKAIQISTYQQGFKERGVTFEPLLGEISNFCIR